MKTKTEVKHTPEPRCAKAICGCQIEITEYMVSTRHCSLHAAAPELLEFAQDVIEAIHHHKGNATGMWSAMEILDKTGRAAIAKAEGK